MIRFHFAFPMPRILLLFLLPLLFTACKGGNSFAKDTYVFDRITIARGPERIPAAIPRSFLPSSVTFIDSVELRSGFSNPRESYLLLESDLSLGEIQKTLENRSSLGDWKMLQKEELQNKTSYLFEGFIKKSLSVLVYDMGEKRVLKYYFKKQSTY
ncbi:hypothetical protein EHQ58_02410 [Leptospira ognonensis]|uniref:Lipoprotein n=1 Tax=Leptospira ognonensis TaxID=2484945 RepID=A0A4R9KAI0_9LEPT|nr:hypothetical protein [Leptospira ognonensis]TGL62738.1 hypothetical protein EHQ58_02410 [Leptospira ognonensis]